MRPMSDSLPGMFVKLHVGPPPEIGDAAPGGCARASEPEIVTHRQYYAREADGTERPIDASEALAILLRGAR